MLRKEQPDSFFDQATIEADGTMVETRAEKKEGIGIKDKGQWGYHPLVVSLAETQEMLYLQNRSGNRPSHDEDASFFFDLAIDQCRKAGFRKIVLQGDTDFSQTEFLDGCERSLCYGPNCGRIFWPNCDCRYSGAFLGI